jgi:hypothetical protein
LSSSSGLKSKQSKNPAEKGRQTSSAGFLLSILFDLEDGGDMFLRNVGLFPNYPPREPQIFSTCSPHLQVNSINFFDILTSQTFAAVLTKALGGGGAVLTIV